MQEKMVLGLSEEGFHRISYQEWPADDRFPPAICVHGLTRNRHDFNELATYLNQYGHHVYCPDIVGRGDSDWLQNPLHYTYEQYLSDLNNLIARMDSPQVDWIGTSMGGLLGMLLASLKNTPLRRLVLNDVGPQIPIKALTRLSQYAGHDPVFNTPEEAKKYFKTIYANFGGLSETQWEKLTKTSIKQNQNGKWTTKLDPNIKAAPAKSKLAWQQLLLHPLKALEGSFFDVDLWHIWRSVRCPVLVIQGQNSDVLPQTVLQKMRESHTNVQVHIVPNAGHAPALMDETTQAVIREFLA